MLHAVVACTIVDVISATCLSERLLNEVHCEAYLPVTVYISSLRSWNASYSPPALLWSRSSHSGSPKSTMLSSSFVPSTCQSVLKIEGATFHRSRFSSSVSSIKIVSMEIRDQRSTDTSTSHGGTWTSGPAPARHQT